MILECNLLHSTSGFEQLWFLQILSIRSHEVEPGPRVRIASIAVDTTPLWLASYELVIRFRTGLLVGIGVGTWVHAIQIDTTIMLHGEALIYRNLAAVVSRGKATPLDYPIVW